MKTNLTKRRDFVRMMTMAGAALPLAPLASSTARAARTTPVPTPAAAAGPSTLHVFAKPMQWLSYDDTAKLIAEAGYNGIDYAVRPGGHVLPEKVEEDLPRAVEAASKAGLKVEMITTAITSAQDKHAETLLRTAAKLGVKAYRFGNFNYDLRLGVWESVQMHKAALKELAALNQSLGLNGAVQNHSGGARVGWALWDLHELLGDLDPRWTGVQYDIRHAVVEGGQAWPVALRLIAPRISCSDIKDFRWQQSPGQAVVENMPLGEGIVPFEAYFKLREELNIGGPISVHFEYSPFENETRKLSDAEKRADFLAAMKRDLQVLKTHLPRRPLG